MSTRFARKPKGPTAPDVVRPRVRTASWRWVEMVPVRLALFTLCLVVVFTATLGLGRLVGPFEVEQPAADHAAHTSRTGEVDMSTPKGLQVADRGYRLVPEATELPDAGETTFRFTVVDAAGEPVTRYAPTHEKELHLVLVRRDLTWYRHVHPQRGSDGTWSVSLPFPGAGAYRAFADFRPLGEDAPLTLGADLAVPGRYDPDPLPTPAGKTSVQGYDVELTGKPTPGGTSDLSVRVSRNGRPVDDLQPYLGAYGHLVAIRSGDLGYLHVHPAGDAVSAGGGPDVRFAVEVPSAGRYRLFFDFRHGDVVRTASFTLDVPPGDRKAGQGAGSSPGHGGHPPGGHGGPREEHHE